MTETKAFNTTLAEPLIEACSEGRFKDVVSLLESGADPNLGVEEVGKNGVRQVYPITATFRVLARGDSLPKMAQRQAERIVDALVQAGAKIRQVEREALIHAVRLGMPEMISFLTDHGARLHRHGHELMEIAILQNKLECAHRLKSLGIDPNVQDQWGCTSFLDICAGKLKLDLVEPALHDADPLRWYRNRMGELFALGVKINNTDRAGATALMRAIVCRQEVIVRALLEEGSSLQPVMRNGVGALHLAASSGSLECFKRVARHASDRSQIERMSAAGLPADVQAHLAFLRSQPAQPGIGTAS